MQRTVGYGWTSGMVLNGAQITGGVFPDVEQTDAFCSLVNFFLITTHLK